ncbi:uncharacterized protein [Dendrobates tinctorius]|uniref:uncharacterized protein n=1 Tax=Dendrobates tinctorius TaxID=92724 RepID=UPI003CC95FC6
MSQSKEAKWAAKVKNAVCFLCTTCKTALPSAQTNPLCTGCDPACAQTSLAAADGLPAFNPPEWAASLSRSVESLTQAIDSLRETSLSHKASLPPEEGSGDGRELSTSRGRTRSGDGQVSRKRTHDASPSHAHASASASSVSRSPSPNVRSEHDSEFESDTSAPQNPPNDQESLDSLIESVIRILELDEKNIPAPAHAISFKRTKRVCRLFTSHPEFKDIVQKHRDRPHKQFTGQKSTEAKYPFVLDLMKDWLQSPLVDPPVSRLASKMLLSVSEGSSVRNPSDRQIDYIARSVFEPSGVALCPSFAATWVTKAMAAWA